MSIVDDPGVSVCFGVTIDNSSYNLGLFTTCDGLGCEVTVESRQEGGNNGFVYQLPGPMKFTNVKFTRPINADSAKVANWISKTGPGMQRCTAVIRALRADGTEVCRWALQSVFPVKWTGPQFSADGPKVAIETLEIAHHGFMPHV